MIGSLALSAGRVSGVPGLQATAFAGGGGVSEVQSDPKGRSPQSSAAGAPSQLAEPTERDRSESLSGRLSLGTVLALQDGEAGGQSTGQASGTPEDPSQAQVAEEGATVTNASAAEAGAEEEESGINSEDPDGDGLNQEEEKQVQELAARDREVRAHEQAHARVGGQYAGAPSYTFQQGPDGKRYAIGGEVSIDSSTERTPEATIRKMQIVIRAATAPAEPSSQDLKVAQQARANLAEAQAEARQQRAEDLGGGDEEDQSAGDVSGTDRGGDADRAQGAEGSSASDNQGNRSGNGQQERALAAYQAIAEAQATASRGLFA